MIRMIRAVSHRVVSIFRTPTPGLLYTVALVESVPATLVARPFQRIPDAPFSPHPGGKHRRAHSGHVKPCSQAFRS